MVDPVSLGIQLGLAALQMGMQALHKVEGPRVDNLKFAGGDYGAPKPRLWGKRRLFEPTFWGEDLKEVKRRRKTKGGKFNDYTYFGTWASALACHEIAGVTRIWLDKHLVYDATGAGPLSPFDLGEGVSIKDHLRFQLGTMTQPVDPRMQASVEAKQGAGSCPAYLGTPYAMWEDLPLEKFGNRIPQGEYEVVSLAAPHYPWESFATIAAQPHQLWNFTFSTDFARLMWVDGAGIYEIWDVAARGRMISGTLSDAISVSSRLGMYADGHFLAISADGTNLLSFAADGTGAASLVMNFPDAAFVHRWQSEVRVLADAHGTEHWMTLPFGALTHFYFDGADMQGLALTGVDWQPSEYFADENGSIWIVARVSGTGVTTAYFYRLIAGTGASGPDFVAVTGLSANSFPFGGCTAAAHGGYFILCWDVTSLYKIDPATGAVVASRTGLGLDVYNTPKQFANLQPGSKSIWLNSAEVSLSDLSTIRTVTLSNWKSEDADGSIFVPGLHALLGAPQFDQLITFRYLDRIDGSGVTLRQIVEDVCEMAGIDLAEIDASALTQIVPGYSVTQGSGKDWLEPLLELYDVDARPHGFGLQFVPRGGAAGAAIDWSSFAVTAGDGSGPAPPLYQSAGDGGSALPSAVSLQFADIAADQQPQAALSGPFFTVDSARVTKLDMGTLALGVDEARQLSARYHRRRYFDRAGYALALPSRFLALEPADVRPLALPDGVTVTARLASMVLGADRRLTCEWKRDDPSAALLDGATGAVFDGRDPAVIAVPLLSKGFVLDIPLVRDIDNSLSPVVYLAAAPYAAGSWPGATIFRSLGGEYSDEIGSLASSDEAVWGYAGAALPWANPNLWDRGNVLVVTPQVGSLTGVTEAAVDADRSLNLAAYGAPGRWELINFTVASLQMDGSYQLSGLKRGRRGTEWAAELHADGDQFVLLSSASAAALGLSDVGINQSFKAVTGGRTAAGTFPIPLTPFTGASLKPYAPCQLRAVKDSGSGDWALRWTRRTRVGGAWTGGAPIPLGEASEAYVVEIMNGASVVRTISGLSTPAATWTAAQQTSDFGSSQSTVDFRVAQISDAVGRGFMAEAAV